MNISVLGNKGILSKELKSIIDKEGKNFQKLLKNNYNFIIATYSPTLREDNYKVMKKEINYYKKLIKSIESKDFLIYISSQTLELNNYTFYSKAKKSVEDLIILKVKNFVIIRPGMIFDDVKFRYNLDTLNKSSRSLITFLNDIPKTTVCSVRDLYELIIFISLNPKLLRKNIVNIGIKRFKFSDLQNVKNKKKLRINLLPFQILKILSFFNTRLKAYVLGKASDSSPALAWLSSFDK